jgi:hypothetical protein
MASRTTTRGGSGFIYFPLKDVFYPKWKVIITDQDGTDYTIADFEDGSSEKNYLLSASVTRAATSKLSSAVISFSNPVNDDTMLCEFTNKFSGGEDISIYADYNDATTLIFRGKVDNPKNSLTGNGFVMEIDARNYPEMTDITIVGAAYSSKADAIIWDVLDTSDFDDVILCFWDGSSWVESSFNDTTRIVTWGSSVPTFPTTTMTFSWQDKKPWSIIEEVCGRAGLDCFLEYDETNEQWLLKTFVIGSLKNNTFAAGYGQNIISFTNFGPENTDIYNRVTGYGFKESSNIISLSTEEDLDSQAELWRKYYTITDNSLKTNEELRARVLWELSRGTQDVTSGSLTVVGEETILPGQQIVIGIPQLSVSGYYTVREVTHTISSGGFITDISIQRVNNRIDAFFKEKVDIEKESEPFENLNGMLGSFNIYFDETTSLIAEHSGTEEVDGKLQLTSGQTTGIATTVSHNTPFAVTEVELRKYSNFPTDENDTYEVSNDGGVTWFPYVISSGSTVTFSTTNNFLRVRLTLRRESVDNPTPSYESIVLLYK